ncbi:DUF6585 family protein [Actinoallomurus sp. NPDC050550]|uniref:DUF6585 family protein n=1 Tax=Actinoallomurus sp. NPDC050550 TaxID=3154937 RepID=UPI0033CB7524
MYPAVVLPATRFWIAGVFAVAGLALLAEATFLAVVLLVIAAIFAVRILPGISTNRRNAGKCAVTFERGLVFIGGQGRVRILPWRTASVLQRIVEHRQNGVLVRTTYRYQLTGSDGTTLTLFGGLVNPEKWGWEIQDGITRAQLPVALETVAGAPR